jgi:hypothetical protein
MNLWTSLLAAAAIVLTSATALAQDTTTSRRQTESFYFTIGMGAGLNSYPDETTRDLETFYGRPASGALAMSIEGGVLWPVAGDRTLLGAMVTVTGESNESSGMKSDRTVTGIHASFRQYLISNPGDGPYLRGDAGVAMTSSSSESRGTYGFGAGSSTSGEWGPAVLIGAGYAFPLGSGTSLSVDASYTWRSLPGYQTGRGATSNEPFEAGTYSSAMLMVSIFW